MYFLKFLDLHPFSDGFGTAIQIMDFKEMPSFLFSPIPDCNEGSANAGSTSGRQYRHWPNVGLIYIVVWEAIIRTNADSLSTLPL